MTEAVFAEGLTKSYGGRLVVDRLDLSVERGRVFGLLGANGAGKSTAIECILGTRQPDSGTIRLLGQDPRKHRSALFQRIGVQFQEGDYPRKSGSRSSAGTPPASTAAPPTGTGSAGSSASATSSAHR